MTRPQKGKKHKRRKSWHRGKSEARNWRRVQLPELGSGADPTEGAPTPVRNDGRRRLHYES